MKSMAQEKSVRGDLRELAELELKVPPAELVPIEALKPTNYPGKT